MHRGFRWIRCRGITLWVTTHCSKNSVEVERISVGSHSRNTATLKSALYGSVIWSDDDWLFLVPRHYAPLRSLLGIRAVNLSVAGQFRFAARAIPGAVPAPGSDGLAPPSVRTAMLLSEIPLTCLFCGQGPGNWNSPSEPTASGYEE